MLIGVYLSGLEYLYRNTGRQAIVASRHVQERAEVVATPAKYTIEDETSLLRNGQSFELEERGAV